MHPANLGGARYELKRQMFKLVGADFRIYDTAGNLVLFSHQKGFRLKEDIRVYTDETKQHEALVITARQIIDFSAAYDVWDPVAQQRVGALKRKGWKSILRDEWIVMDAHDREIAVVIEDSSLLALLRRFLTNLIPQNYGMLVNGTTQVADYKQHWNPFLYWLSMDFSMDRGSAIDPRLKIATGILLAAIERRQN
ncbi:MAG: hypothetical protein IIC73_06790 [Armatimonadetes bacterium]|nr:hypothetical protein [Armatimonadota bacterium]